LTNITAVGQIRATLVWCVLNGWLRLQTS